jgi:ABC-type transporter Mla subunit MlaD
MSSLESAVERLAGSLDSLEAKLQERLHDLSERSEDADSLRARARAAKDQTAAASSELTGVIRDLKALIASSDVAGVENTPLKRAAGE